MLYALVQFLKEILFTLPAGGGILSKLITNIVHFPLNLISVVVAEKPIISLIISLCITILLTVSALLLQASGHFAINLLRGRRARAFISYQHERQSVADELALAMRRGFVVPTLLPFLSDPDHDRLLSSVKQGIRESHVVVCLPGAHPSFVENEVAMAFALNKPMVFIVGDDEYAWLPNTAKIGYPIFDLEALRINQWIILVDFLSYIAADARSTLRLYGTVINYLRDRWGIFLLTFLFAAIFVNYNQTYSFAVVGLFFIPYMAYFISRYLIRRGLRDTISGKQFDFVILPEKLDYSLSRANLLIVQKKSPIIPKHQYGSASKDKRNIFVRPNRSKIAFHVIMCFAIIPAILLFLSLFSPLELIFDLFYANSFISYVLGVTFAISASFFGLLVVIKVVTGITLFRELILASDFVVNSKGIIDGFTNRDAGLISWDQISTISDKASGSEFIITLQSQKSINVDLEYYDIDKKHVIDVIQTYLIEDSE